MKLFIYILFGVIACFVLMILLIFLAISIPIIPFIYWIYMHYSTKQIELGGPKPKQNNILSILKNFYSDAQKIQQNKTIHSI